MPAAEDEGIATYPAEVFGSVPGRPDEALHNGL